MGEAFREHEVVPQQRNVLVFEHYGFCCVVSAGLLFDTLMDNPVRTFSQFTDSFVLFSKKLGVLKGRVGVALLSL